MIDAHDRQNIMKQWDYWRKRIAEGDTSSAPRDWFESVLDTLEYFPGNSAGPGTEGRKPEKSLPLLPFKKGGI